ncbi:MAG: 4-(cytidine 5'-diphospho)-2-C-methyl-D-erythritol kinase [Acidobacteriaceae bacterium]|nr:4-(cytidine 5'-diphospho)-2-C-methyl-D-erythritol kinase [Acidobacteriaceae bacterium]
MATTVRSYSKINLGLAIGPVRADGFHGLATLYQTLALHDLVTVEARRLAAGESRISLTTNHAQVPTDARNTAWKIVERALARMNVTAEVAVHIEKRLPVQGGMGAGSANAAAALIGLESELEMALPETVRLEIAAEVGSDVPLFLLGGAVQGTQRGEIVRAMQDFPATACVIAVPEVGVSTPRAFRDWDERQAQNQLTSAPRTDKLDKLSHVYASVLGADLKKYGVKSQTEKTPDTSGIVRGRSPEIKQGGLEGETPRHGSTWNGLAENTLLALVRTGIENDFEEVVFPQYPLLREIKRLLMGTPAGASSGAPADSSGNALCAALSGSGSALFGLYRSTAEAEAAQQRVQASGCKALLTETLPRQEYWRTMFAE